MKTNTENNSRRTNLKLRSVFEYIVISFCVLVLGSVLAAYTITSFELIVIDYDEMDFDAILVGPFTSGHIFGTD